MDTNDHKQSQSSQQKPASSQQSRNVGLLRGVARPVPRYAVTIETNNARNKKDFLSAEEKEQSQKLKNSDDFRKVSRYF